MAVRPKRKQDIAKAETFQASTKVVGPAFTMPDDDAAFALAEDIQIDFQAKQDSISPTRRAPGPKLQPKVKRTSARPSKAKETPVKI